MILQDPLQPKVGGLKGTINAPIAFHRWENSIDFLLNFLESVDKTTNANQTMLLRERHNTEKEKAVLKVSLQKTIHKKKYISV